MNKMEKYEKDTKSRLHVVILGQLLVLLHCLMVIKIINLLPVLNSYLTPDTERK